MEESIVENEQNLMAEGKRRGPGLVLRGICMGTADVIPGVSGGTVALIMGIYDELVGTIASIDQRVVGALVRGRIAEVLRLINATFLIPLLFGIGLAIV
jgi:putative membrane protein